MTAVVLTDRLLREALAPAALTVSLAEVAQVVSERTHRQRQVRRRLPWLLSPAATFAEARRVHLVRVVLVGALLALSAGAAIAGARLWLRVEAPPQVLLLQGGLGYSVSLDGGERRPITALAGRNVIDFSLALDGSLLATLRAPRNVLEIWDAPDVLNGVATAPIALPNTGDLLVLDTGVWRPDGQSLLISASAHGAHRVYLVDIASGTTTQVSPPNVYVDDWQPSFDGRWIEIAGQYQGHNVLYVVDLTDLTFRSLLESEWDRVPEGGALGWSPDSRTMTFHLQHGIRDLGIWRIDVDGTDIRQVTPPGQPAGWMSWSPDGQWIAYETDSAEPTCATGGNRRAVWIVRPDGRDAHLLADNALALYWADDARSFIVASSQPLPNAPLGGVIHAFLDGSAPELVYAHTEADDNGDGKSCHRYGSLTKFYRALSRGIH